MDSSTGTRGRGRKRHTLPVATSSQNLPESTEQPSSVTPVASMASSSFSLETPSPSVSRDTRTRPRQVDGITASPEDSTSKGGRSLRKRPRVDYTFDQLDDLENYSPKAAPSTTRTVKRRKTDITSNENENENKNENDEDVSEAPAKRRASEQPQPSTTRRRNTRKSTVEPQTQAYGPSQQQADDVEVQDTIEVGGHHSSESDESTLRRTTSGSSTNDSKPVPLDTSVESLTTTQHSLPSHTPQASQRSLSDESQPHLEGKLQTGVAVNGNVDNEIGSQAHTIEDAISDMNNDAIAPDSFDHLTPYIEGAHVYYPEYPEDDLEQEAELEPNSQSGPEVRTPADSLLNAEIDIGSQGNAEANTNADVDHVADPELESNEVNQHGTEDEIIAEADAAAHDQVDGAIETPAETTANTPSAEADLSNTHPPERQQFRFKQTRSASEFTDLFKDIKSLSHEELYRRVEVANRALVAWQEEFKELRKHTDDYDNAVRYQKDEESFQKRYEMAVGKNPAANPLRKDFVVKGIRAPDPTEPEVAYYRQQDRTMANVYGFEYDHRMDRLGRQDPIAQRTGLGRHGRLRERPKQTAKAAEAEDPNVVQGKRTRKAPERLNGGETASRGSTPAPTQRRGRRGAQVQDSNEQNQVQDAPDANPAPATTEPEVPKKKGKGGRPRKNPLPAPAPEAVPTPAPEPELDAESDGQPEPEKKPQQKAAPKSRAKTGPKTQPKVESTSPKRAAEPDVEEEQPTRKRRRRGPAPASAPTAPIAPSVVDENSKKSDPPHTSFTTTTSATTTTSTAQAEEIRPPTASSTATAETVASTSNYQLREKRQRKFTNDGDDDDDDIFVDAPKPKRARRAPKKSQAKAGGAGPAPVAAPVQQPESGEPDPPKPLPRIKLKLTAKGNPTPRPPTAPTSNTPLLAPSTSKTPANASSNVNGGGVSDPDASDGEAKDNKDYHAMTKSEKMSQSMKARWASGSMGVAVEKRRATLAAKKQSGKASTAGSTATPDQTLTPAPTV